MAHEGDMPGWQNTRWGMLADQVRLAAGAEKVKQTERQTYLRFYSDMKIPNVPIGRLPFDVIFQMDEQSHRLRQVLVLHQGDPSREPAEATSATRAVLEEWLGPAAQTGPGDLPAWVFATTTVALNSFHIAGSMSAVGVRFFPTGEDPAAPPPSPAASA